MLNLTVDLSAYGYLRDPKLGTYFSCPGYDTAPIEVVATSIYENADGGTIAIILFDGVPIFRTFTETEYPDGPDDLRGARFYRYVDRLDASLFLSFLDVIGATSGAYESFVGDESTTVDGAIEDNAVDGGLDRFAAFIATITRALDAIENE